MSDQPLILSLGDISFEVTELSAVGDGRTLMIQCEYGGGKFRATISFADANRLADLLTLITGYGIATRLYP